MKIKGSLFSSSIRIHNPLSLRHAQVFQVVQQQTRQGSAALWGTDWHPPLLRWVWVCTHGSAKMKQQRGWNREHTRALSGHCVTGQTRAGLGLSLSLQGHLCSTPQLWRKQTQFMPLPLWHDLAASALRWMRIAHSDCRDQYLGWNRKEGIQDHPNFLIKKGKQGKK